jgi:hypothetical protein
MNSRTDSLFVISLEKSNFLFLPELSSIFVGAPYCLLVKEDYVQPYEHLGSGHKRISIKSCHHSDISVLSCTLEVEGVVIIVITNLGYSHSVLSMTTYSSITWLASALTALFNSQ